MAVAKRDCLLAPVTAGRTTNDLSFSRNDGSRRSPDAPDPRVAFLCQRRHGGRHHLATTFPAVSAPISLADRKSGDGANESEEEERETSTRSYASSILFFFCAADLEDQRKSLYRKYGTGRKRRRLLSTCTHEEEATWLDLSEGRRDLLTPSCRANDGGGRGTKK